MTDFKFRQQQWDIIGGYSRGLMGISAVPGSGKTFTLSHLAAQLVQRLDSRSFKNEREVLIVTFTNSAVNSFKSRIAHILEHERGLLPYSGYRVRTLHGLAHDIVRERPTLVGLAEDFRIVDERVSRNIQIEAVNAHLPEWRPRLAWILDEDISENQQNRVFQHHLPVALEDLAARFISNAKAHRQTPEDLLNALNGTDETFDLARFAVTVYQDYQRSLAYRGAVDFDDLVRLALIALEEDERFLKRQREKWPYILEDEAQDSSKLQQEMLELLSAGKNWVRVGDPNQAINTTFTTADLRYLREFLARDDVREHPLSKSGRSSRKIMELANELARWSVYDHPVSTLRDAFYFQRIEPTEPGDVQENPRDAVSNIYIYPANKQLTPDDELNMVVRNLLNWLPDNPDKTVAVLVPENNRGYQLAEQLKHHHLDYEELLRSTTETRQTARILGFVMDYLADPRSARKLAQTYHGVWLRHISALGVDNDDEDEDNARPPIARLLSRLNRVEEIIWPVETDWREVLKVTSLDDEWQADLQAFIILIRRWLDATSLPIDQLVLTISGDIFTDPADIALAYKIAVVLKSISRDHASYRLTEFAEELRRISENERRFIGFDDSETGYEPKPSTITIATLHAAKGLEWDRVYLMAVNNYSFPSALEYEEFIGEKWFVRDNLNLEAEIMAQLQALIDGKLANYHLGDASKQDRFANAAERLRLLYVGITRAKSELIITWNTGRFWEQGGHRVKQPALPLIHLLEHLNG